jgi:hypothetical protein
MDDPRITALKHRLQTMVDMVSELERLIIRTRTDIAILQMEHDDHA